MVEVEEVMQVFEDEVGADHAVDAVDADDDGDDADDASDAEDADDVEPIVDTAIVVDAEVENVVETEVNQEFEEEENEAAIIISSDMSDETP